MGFIRGRFCFKLLGIALCSIIIVACSDAKKVGSKGGPGAGKELPATSEVVAQERAASNFSVSDHPSSISYQQMEKDSLFNRLQVSHTAIYRYEGKKEETGTFNIYETINTKNRSLKFLIYPEEGDVKTSPTIEFPLVSVGYDELIVELEHIWSVPYKKFYNDLGPIDQGMEKIVRSSLAARLLQGKKQLTQSHFGFVRGIFTEEDHKLALPSNYVIYYSEVAEIETVEDDVSGQPTSLQTTVFFALAHDFMITEKSTYWFKLTSVASVDVFLDAGQEVVDILTLALQKRVDKLDQKMTQAENTALQKDSDHADQVQKSERTESLKKPGPKLPDTMQDIPTDAAQRKTTIVIVENDVAQTGDDANTMGTNQGTESAELALTPEEEINAQLDIEGEEKKVEDSGAQNLAVSKGNKKEGAVGSEVGSEGQELTESDSDHANKAADLNSTSNLVDGTITRNGTDEERASFLLREETLKKELQEKDLFAPVEDENGNNEMVNRNRSAISAEQTFEKHEGHQSGADEFVDDEVKKRSTSLGDNHFQLEGMADEPYENADVAARVATEGLSKQSIKDRESGAQLGEELALDDPNSASYGAEIVEKSVTTQSKDFVDEYENRLENIFEESYGNKIIEDDGLDQGKM